MLPTEDEAYRQALGAELRNLRKSRGWTRKTLNARLGNQTSLQTLATYEHGTRHCSVARFSELCRAMNEEPHVVLARAEGRLRPVESGALDVDLAAAAKTTDPRLAPLARWAAGRLDAGGNGTVSLSAAAVELLAELCGTSPRALTRQITKYQQAA